MTDKKTPTTKSQKKPVARKPTAKKPERGLGRGLSALMTDVGLATAKETADPKSGVKATATQKASQKPSAQDSSDRSSNVKPSPQNSGVTTLAIDQLMRNPDQPRRYFDPTKLSELTQSIRDKGVLQPILVRPVPRRISQSKKMYQIVAGERRWQAALKAGLTNMPVLVRDLSDRDVLEIGVVENVQRADLNPIEEAMAYRALIDQFDRTQKDVAEAIGKSRPHIANMLRLLTLPERAQAFLQEGKISTGHARAIIASPDPVALAEHIVEKNLSVRESEDWVRRLKRTDAPLSKVPAIKDADTRQVETDLMTLLGLAVDLRHKSPGGELRIKYKSGDQLDDLIRRLKA